MSTSPDSPHHYDYSALVEAQKAYFQSGSTRSMAFRLERLAGLAAEIERRSEDILDALARDLGKPRLEAYVSEVYFVLAEIRLFLRNLRKWSRPRRVGHPFYFLPARSEVRREPFGTALIAAPWNYPVQLALSPLVAAVGAGNTVVLKPSELAPATASLLAEIVHEVFNPQHVALVEGGAETGEALLAEPFDFFFYTGSERVGRLYAEAAAKRLAPVVLELGGKCPCIVADDAPIERTAERIVATKFFNAGQTCIAPDYVLVSETRHDAFVKAATETLERCYGEGNEKASGDLARIVNARHFERVRALIPESAVRVGEDDEAGRFLAPTLIPRADRESPAMREEVFGPVLPILTYVDLDEELDFLASGPSPLALYAFSRNRETLEAIAARVPSGSVCFNDAIKQSTNLNLPFGGVGASGMGRYRGRSGLESFTYERAVTKRTFLKDPFLVCPPYEGKLEKLRRFLK